ncbi:hypothetical protein GQ457_12G014390 [Hibiscus cannabinus]
MNSRTHDQIELQSFTIESSSCETNTFRFRIPEIAQNIHPNKQESKVRKLLPEASKNRKSQFPEQGEIGGKSKRVCG